MVMLHFEGGEELALPLRTFIEKAEPGVERAFRCIYGGGRDETMKDYLDGLADDPRTPRMLLLDSEGPFHNNILGELDQHLAKRTGNKSSLDGERVGWMVQLMEAWFLADVDALKAYYGAEFRESVLPGDPKNVEAIRKDDVVRGLEDATRSTTKGKYVKNHAPRLLDRLNPDIVRKASLNCDGFLKKLASLVQRVRSMDTGSSRS
jgi:hypothetical protein